MCQQNKGNEIETTKRVGVVPKSQYHTYPLFCQPTFSPPPCHSTLGGVHVAEAWRAPELVGLVDVEVSHLAAVAPLTLNVGLAVTVAGLSLAAAIDKISYFSYGDVHKLRLHIFEIFDPLPPLDVYFNPKQLLQ